MTTERIVNRLIDSALRFYYRRWEPWEMLALGLAGLFLLMMATRTRRKIAASEKHRRERATELNA